MNKKFFTYYPIVGPLFLAPLSFWLWWVFYRSDLRLTLTAWLLPILYAYIVPGIGTNILQMWEFNTKLRLGRFRPHHGFVFGSATATLAWLAHPAPCTTAFSVIQTALIFASVLGFVNIIYDIKAIKSGILIVYNKPWSEHESEAQIVMDYAPWFFGAFGFVYGFGLGLLEWTIYHYMMSNVAFIIFFFAILFFEILLPVWGYCRSSMKNYGHNGCHSYKGAV